MLVANRASAQEMETDMPIIRRPLCPDSGSNPATPELTYEQALERWRRVEEDALLDARAWYDRTKWVGCDS